MSKYYKVKFKHWWYWFIPKYRKERQKLDNLITAHEIQLEESIKYVMENRRNMIQRFPMRKRENDNEETL